jgi:hypothetical protein
MNADEIRPLVTGYGSCFATDRITVDGLRVGYMYREVPRDAVDSGWHFFSGDEPQEYVDNPRNFAIYNVNTIANYDPDIIPLFDKPPGTTWARDLSGTFTKDANNPDRLMEPKRRKALLLKQGFSVRY